MFKPIRKGWQPGGVGILFSLCQRNQSHSREFPSRKILPYVNPWFKNLNLTYSLRCFFFFGFRICPNLFALSRSMFFRAIKAVISRQPEALNLSDFFILRFITYVLIFVVRKRWLNRDFALKSLHIWFFSANSTLNQRFLDALPHDRFKLSTLVHLEGPLTLLLATVIITLEL